MRRCLFALLICFTLPAAASDSLRIIGQRPMLARFIATDDLGNTYAMHTDGTLARYNARGDSTGFYRTVLNGAVGAIDATNPLRILLYYPTYNQIQVLDRQLALRSEIDLRRLRIFSPTAVATASDGNLWVYDPYNARILKLDDGGTIIQEGIDLRQQLPFVPQASYLLERNRRLYLCDTAHGILVFDQFATHLETLPFIGLHELQVFDNQIVFARGDSLHRYNMQTFKDAAFPLPLRANGIVAASLQQRMLSVLYLNKLVIWEWPPASLQK